MKGVNKVRKSRRGDYVGLKQYLLPIVNGDGKIKDGQFSLMEMARSKMDSSAPF